MGKVYFYVVNCWGLWLFILFKYVTKYVFKGFLDKNPSIYDYFLFCLLACLHCNILFLYG